MQDDMTSHSLADRLGRWFGDRLDQSVEPRRATARMYGLEIVDPEGIDDLDPMAVRTTFVAEAPDGYAVLRTPGSGPAAGLFDAVATVEWAWVPGPAVPRPGRFARRDRRRTIRVVLHPDLAGLDAPRGGGVGQ